MERGRQKHWSFRNEPEFIAPPGLLAEQLAPEIALSGLRAFMTRRKPAGLFQSAWGHVEYALNQNHPSFDNQLRQKYLGDASYLLGRIITENERVSDELFLRALTLNSYMPAFAKRTMQQSITTNDCYDVYQSLGVTLKHHQMYSYSGERSWRFAETITHAASARTGQPELLLWPTSPREEASATPTKNHDGYFFDGYTKIRTQLKLIETGKEYDPDIIVIYLLPLLDHACKRAGLSEELDFGRSLDYANEAIIAETAGQPLRVEQSRFLDYFCRSLAARSRYSRIAA